MFRRKSGPLSPSESSSPGAKKSANSEQAVSADSTPTSKRLFKLTPKRAPPPPPPPSSSAAPKLDEGWEESAELLIAQSQCSREQAIVALQHSNGDVVDALMFLAEKRVGNYDENPRGSINALNMLISTGVPEDVARQALVSCGGDVVEALLSLNNAVLTAVESDKEEEENHEDADSDDDVMGFAAKIHQQLKSLHRKSVNLTPMTRKDMIEQEILSSEQVYLSGVEKLLVYVELLSAKAPVEEAKRSFKDIVGPLKQVVQFHSKLMQSLRSKVHVADALMAVEKLEGPYGDVIELIQSLLPRMDEWDGSKSMLKNFLKDHGSLTDFQSHLILPVQRIPRYQLFLRDLLKCIDPNQDSKEFGRLRDTLQKVEIVNRAINKRLANVTNRLRMQSLAAQFSSDPNLSADNRLLEKEGFVKMKEKKDKWAQRKLFLFNDLFVVALKSGSKLKVAEQYPLVEVRCSQQDEDEFVVRVKSKANFEMVFKCETMQETLEWLHSITNGIATYHLFGSLSNVNGLKGKNFSNWVNNTDHSKGSVAWTWSATDLNSCDPNHNVDITSDKIYGIRQAEAFNFSSPSMDGFVEAESMLHKEKAKALNYCEVMTGFDDGQLPVLNFLAKNFALFDEYFCSVPGPTFPNRFFALTGTAAGLTNTGPFFRNSSSGLLFPQKTIFEQLAEEGHDCAFYYKGTPWELQLRGVIHNPEMLHPFDDFLRSAKDGTLPSFSFINPLAGIEPGFDSMKGCNDFHPDHSVALGEAFLKQIYDAVRQGPDWSTTALLINFDEHGGFADHVPPPQKNIPKPDSQWDVYGSYPQKFDFDRLGVRVPLLVVSPLVPNMVVSRPPDGEKHFEHCSILSTTRKLLNVTSGPLTKRDAWAPDFAYIFNLSSARDTPFAAPEPKRSELHFLDERALPPNDLQLALVDNHNKIASLLHPAHVPMHVTRQEHVFHSMKNSFESVKKSILAHDTAYDLVFAVLPRFGFTAGIESGFQVKKDSIATMNLHVGSTPFCLTKQDDSTVSVSLCRTISTRLQKFYYKKDFTIRFGSSNSNECLTASDNNSTEIGVRSVFLSACEAHGGSLSLRQHFGYWGPAPGNTNDGFITFGNTITVLQVVNKTFISK